MKKTHKVVMLSTEKASPLFSYKERPDLLYYQPLREWTSIVNHLHLYIISDDKIKEGDWYLNLETKQIYNTLKYDFYKVVTDRFPSIHKKIVATTDKSITKDIATSGKFYEPLPQLPESFIQAYIKAYNEGKPITEVDLEMMDIPIEHSNRTFGDKESLDPNGERSFYIGSVIKTRPDNTVIIHQSKMYSRDEMEKAYREGFKDGLNKIHRASEWIQDNL